MTPGPGSATLHFSVPADNGGSPIATYTATCTASEQPTRTATGSAAPLTVRDLTEGVVCQCMVSATSAACLTGGASEAQTATPRRPGGITPILMLLLD
ncbi:MAG: hypothetical protein IPN53_20075 [Comamonadaceae bacterium]|nr:hypothetical protein [Comamonadaceae bacterium]